MKVVTGEMKGTTIGIPRAAIRCTSDKVRQAVFDVIRGADVTSVLDIFAGSGSMGLEALSSGASRAVFVDSERACIDAIRSNISRCGFDDKSEVLDTDAYSAMELLWRKGDAFDLIFSDPPYHGQDAKKSLISLAGYDILSQHGILVIEHLKNVTLPDRAEGLILYKTKLYGDTALSFYTKD
ncbi:MAG: 16S rRNA (guanine(966)-N(2))-methyltransferase RsmD [Candidatus Omnitrophica bacterium CG1_02_49_10]|nr:MAG: 16S rRNA (guanine(966)-N(2))-methyltransferase RsmD [Candidatus Omnitrophica bacterium CG1_02_49_10]